MEPVKEYIKKRIEELDLMTSAAQNNIIIDEVKECFDIDIDGDYIYEAARRKRKEDISNDTYEVKDGAYIFIQDDLRYTLPVEEIDKMFYDFSKHGGNLSWEEMLEKYQLKPNVWYMIKNRLRLYKDSNVISPYTAENTPKHQLDKIVVDATHRHIDTIKQRMVQTHEKLYAKESKRAIKTLSNVEYFLDNIEKYIDKYKAKEIKWVEKQKPSWLHPLVIAMSDFHFGKKWTADIVKRMSLIKDFILSQPHDAVHIMSLWDLWEAFVEGGMHDGQSEWMEMHGFGLMMFIVSIFEKMLTDVYASGKCITFTGIGGNHDRMGKSHGQDMSRTWALVIYEMIKRGMSKTDIKMNILTEKVNSFAYGSTHYIIHHGDDGFSNRRAEDILWKNGNNSKHNVILNGDKHNATFKETKNATWVQLPALAWAWEYDARLDLHSEPWFVIIEENEYGTVDVLIKRLP